MSTELVTAQTPEHSPIGASGAHRWFNCPASVRLSKHIESTTSSYAAEGTLAHSLAEAILSGKAHPKDALGNDDMYTAVWQYIDEINRIKDSIKGEVITGVEVKVHLSSIDENLYGTIDKLIYAVEEKKLYVIDYKHGAGIPVEVKKNLQLKYYTLGALLKYSFACVEVEMIIVQPRCPHPDGPIRREVIPAYEFIDFAGELKQAALRTQDPKSALKAGSWCRFCPVAAVCPEIHKQALTQAKEEFSLDFTYDAEKLKTALEWLPILEGWTKGVREFAYAEALQGRMPLGHKLVEKRATRKWINAEDATTTMINVFGLKEDLMFKKDLKSPAQIEKLLKGKTKKAIKELTVSISSGSTLVPESDARQPLKLDAKSDFDDAISTDAATTNNLNKTKKGKKK